jgi:hypothetical protein
MKKKILFDEETSSNIPDKVTSVEVYLEDPVGL